MVRKIAPVINIVLLTLAVYLAVDFFYKVVATKLETALPVVSSQTRQSTPRGTAADRPLREYAVIAERNIFHAEKKESGQPETLDVENLKKTTLDLRLLGTISGLGKNSFAVIEETRSRKQKLYKVGDTVDQARIKLVLRKKVVLTIDGRDEVLEIPEERLASLSDADRRGGAYRANNRRFDAGTEGEVSNVTLNRADVERAFNNVNELMRSVRVRPHFSDGKPDGLRLDNVTRGSIFTDMGLQDKDVIVGVNSRRINSVDDCMEVYRNLSSASELMLEVKRDNQNRFIKYTIR